MQEEIISDDLFNRGEKVSVPDYKIKNHDTSEFLDYKVLNIKKVKFSDVNLSDSFFDSLKKDYPDFQKWFEKKKDSDCYISIDADNNLKSFLYLKIENKNEIYDDIRPKFNPKKRLKIGTFKVANTGSRIGERFLKIIFDNALKNDVEEIYVTVFESDKDHQRIIDLLSNWGFKYWGTKDVFEAVYCRPFLPPFPFSNIQSYYPFITLRGDIFLVPIYPKYHTELFPDSILNTESPKSFAEDKACRNGIIKIYVSQAFLPHPKSGDILIFYRTGGYFASVITTIGIVSDVKHNFTDENEFLKYCRKITNFPEHVLSNLWNKAPRGTLFAIKFLYVYSFPFRINLKRLIELGILRDISDVPRGFKKISSEQFKLILKETQSEQSFIIP